MRLAGAITAILLVALAAPAAALAQIQDHDGQPGVRAGLGSGILYVLDYDSRGTSLDRAPFALTSYLTYGLGEALELELGGILSLEGTRPLALSGGVRYFFNPLSFLKLYSTLDAVVPLTPRVDAGLRNEDGLQYDVNAHVGVFLGLDLSILFARELAAGAGIIVGAQGRY